MSYHRSLFGQVANDLAYFGEKEDKSLMGLTPGANVIKLFTAVIYNFCNKLERFSLASLSRLA